MSRVRPFWRLGEDGRTPEPCSFEEWVLANRDAVHVAHDEEGGVRVSTVFLGLAASLYEQPALFETMIFGGLHNGYQQRSKTWQDAEAVHAQALAMARGPAA
jgi:hypothetical protein